MNRSGMDYDIFRIRCRYVVSEYKTMQCGLTQEVATITNGSIALLRIINMNQ
jgi:hypothetical protein